MLKVIHRATQTEDDVVVLKSQKFLYRTLFGRMLLKILIRPFLSKLVGRYLSSSFSKHRIKKFVKKNSILLEDYELDHIQSFNDFFSRKIKEGKRRIDKEAGSFISPCDSKVSVFPIEKNSVYKIKDSYYRIEDLLEDPILAKEYEEGWCFIFRLGVEDYHRYCYIDDGFQEKNITIKGVFHTVNPIALEKYNFYKTNHRSYTVLHTDHFQDVVQIEVGAMFVGKIENYYEQHIFSKGEEKGRFLFGGSTIVLLTKDIIQVDEDILYQSQLGNEVQVSYGEKIGLLRK